MNRLELEATGILTVFAQRLSLKPSGQLEKKLKNQKHYRDYLIIKILTRNKLKFLISDRHRN